MGAGVIYRAQGGGFVGKIQNIDFKNVRQSYYPLFYVEAPIKKQLLDDLTLMQCLVIYLGKFNDPPVVCAKGLVVVVVES